MIFGSYEQLDRINLLTNRLNDAGYTKANYVANLPNSPITDDNYSEQKFASLKNKYYLGWSDVNIFVLFKGSDQGSVAIEIEYLFDKMPEKAQCANFLVEKETYVETLIMGTIEENECYIALDFEDDDELFEFVVSDCWTRLTQDNCDKTRIH